MAIKFNQVRALELIIDFVVDNQNNYTSSYLFLKNLPIILQKGIKVVNLFESRVFQYKFDFDEWPSTHTNNETYIKPYYGDIFDLRNNYDTVFIGPALERLEEK